MHVEALQWLNCICARRLRANCHQLYGIKTKQQQTQKREQQLYPAVLQRTDLFPDQVQVQIYTCIYVARKCKQKAGPECLSVTRTRPDAPCDCAAHVSAFRRLRCLSPSLRSNSRKNDFIHHHREGVVYKSLSQF